MAREISDEKSEIWKRRWRLMNRALEESLAKFLREDSLTVSASIAYYALLSIFPLLLLLLGMSGMLIRRYEFMGPLAMVLERYLPMRPDFIMQNLVGISKNYGSVSLLSIALLLWSSAGMFLPLEKALNRAWEVPKERSWWKSRLVALEMAIILGFLILISSALVGVNVYIHKLAQRWGFHGPYHLLVVPYHALIFLGAFTVTLTMFLILFQRLPNRPMRLRQVFPSALFTTILWEAARSVFTLLLPRFNYRLVYGSIGAAVALMTWAYVSSAVTLFGAQVSRALYHTTSIPASAENPATPAAPSSLNSPILRNSRTRFT